MKTINEDKELNRLDQAFLDLKNDFKEHRNLYIGVLVSLFILSIIISSWIGQEWRILTRQQGVLYITGLFTVWLSSIYMFIMTLFIYGVAISIAYRGRKLMHKDYIKVEDDGESYMLSKETPYGDTHWQTRKEMCEPNPNQDGEVLCVVDKDYYAHKGDILGINKNEEIVSRALKLYSINDNKLGIGASRSGKSAALVINDLMQSLIREESIIITDTKGDLYRQTSSVFRQKGYIVRILNLKSTELKHSDGWEVMKYITEDNDIQADVISNAIILNTLDGERKDYWAKSEMGALKGSILLVATSPLYEGRRSFAEVIDIIKHPDSFEQKFAGLPKDNPAKIAFDNFMQAEPKNRGQILQGLGGRLSLLNNKYVHEIVSNDEIDLIKPVKKKCIYYVVISDTDTTMKFVASMFFTQILQAQCDYVDSLTSKQKKECLRVRYEIDEAKAVGEIPDFDVKISTFASRGIYSTLLFQDIGQLKDTYPGRRGNGWHDIVANSSTKILLAAGDLETAKFFQDLIGETTVKVVNGRYNKGRTKILDTHDDENVGDSLNKRYLLPAAKALHLNRNRIVVVIDGHQPIKINKYLGDKYNPVFTSMSKETPPNKHKPKWRKLKEEHAAEVAKQISELSESDKMIAEDIQEQESEPVKPIGRLEKTVASKKPMTITFENGDEVDMDTGEVISTTETKKLVFDDEPPFKESRKDIKKSTEIKPPDKGKEIADKLNKKYLKGDNILGELIN